METVKTQETKRYEHFDWRDYCVEPEKVSAEVAEKLDTLSEMANDGSEDSNYFLEDVKNTGYDRVPGALVNYFRGVLTSEERKKLHDELTSAIEQRHKVVKHL